MTQFQYQDAKRQGESHGICQDQGPLFDNEAINQPHAHSRRKQGVHSQRNPRNIPSAPGMDCLRQEGNRSHGCSEISNNLDMVWF